MSMSLFPWVNKDRAKWNPSAKRVDKSTPLVNFRPPSNPRILVLACSQNFITKLLEWYLTKPPIPSCPGIPKKHQNLIWSNWVEIGAHPGTVPSSNLVDLRISSQSSKYYMQIKPAVREEMRQKIRNLIVPQSPVSILKNHHIFHQKVQIHMRPATHLAASVLESLFNGVLVEETPVSCRKGKVIQA